MKKLKLIFIGLIVFQWTFAVETDIINPNNPLIEYTGRIDFANPLLPKFSYSGVSVRAGFQGTSISIMLNDAGNSNYYNVILDNGVRSRINTVPGLFTYNIAANLKDTIHEIEIFKITEEKYGKTQFAGFVLDKGKTLVEIPNQRTRCIEFIGNSITCGYGNEGVNGGDPLPSNQNHYLTFAAIASRSFNARHIAVCKSGIGIYRNYDGPVTGSTDCMTNMYQRVFLTDPAPLYDFAKKPDLVCIDLGTNDFSTSKGDSALYVNTYLQFIDSIQKKNNHADILCLLGPMLSGTNLINVRNYLKHIVRTANIKNNGRVRFFEMSQQTGNLGIGVNNHPTVAQHLKNAKELISCIDTLKNWLPCPRVIIGSTPVGNEIDLEFNMDMQDATGTFNGFTVKVDNVPIQLSSVSLDASNKAKIRIILSKSVVAGQKIEVSYASGFIEGKNNVKLERFTDMDIYNKVTDTAIIEKRWLVDDFQSGTLHPRFRVDAPLVISVIDNPSQTGINTSSKVLKLTGNSGSGILRADFNINGQVAVLNIYDRVRFKYYRGNISNNTVLLDQGGSTLKQITPLVAPSGINTWEVVEFAVEPVSVGLHLFRLDKRVTSPMPVPTDAIYIDDLEFYDTRTATPAGITNPVSYKQAYCFPNPATGKVTNLNIDVPEATHAKVDLISFSGSLVKCILNSSINAGTLKFPFEIKNSGMYLIKIVLGNKQTSFLKLIVQ